MDSLKKRATDSKTKKEIVIRLLSAWKSCPDLRFGQLINNATVFKYKDIFYIEDYDLIELVENYVKDLNKKA